MNKIVRILPGIFLSLLSLSSCDGLFTEDCIYKGYLHARNGFRHPSDMGTPATVTFCFNSSCTYCL